MQPPADPDPLAPEPSPEEFPGSLLDPVPAPAAPAAPAIRASDRERDAAVQQLQAAFAEGRLDDQEFDQRMRAALVARTRAELDGVLADLPRSGGLATAQVQSTGRLLLALKGGLARRGRWRVPERLDAVAYKGVVDARPTPTPRGEITRG
jgi:DUF1707 SHOCT-like domain